MECLAQLRNPATCQIRGSAARRSVAAVGKPVAERLVWERDGRDWPNRQASRFVQAGGLRWHVQMLGQGLPMLLLHGTGSATHSWRGLLPLLARHYQVLAPDLPGHGFTERPAARRMSLRGMAAAVSALLPALGVNPLLAVGHSAGAALLARMCLDGTIAPRVLVSLNGALLPLPGLPGLVFPPLAKVVSRFGFVPRLFAHHAADQPLVAELLEDTGSTIDTTGIALYQRLASNPQHVGAALDMMANWDLGQLGPDLPCLRAPLFLVTGSNDRTIPPGDIHRLRALLPRAQALTLPGLGHLAHEEQPRLLAALLLRTARTCAAPPGMPARLQPAPPGRI
jgi:magnesium chelatase accessory protein